MAELLSVGLDVGTTTTQLILSRLVIENRATGFSVPQMEIAKREVIYTSVVYFTPLLGQDLVDAEGIRKIVEAEYATAGISRDQVDTGAIIITGETSRKENAQAVLQALSAFAGEFVVATAGPDLESILAAHGAGAVSFSAATGKTVLHMDIGGGTSNLALIEKGNIIRTGCLNVGGRLIKTDSTGKICYISSVVQGLTALSPGDAPDPGKVQALTQQLTQALEMAAGLRPATNLLDKLLTRETEQRWLPPKETNLVLSFSGGVADCIDKQLPSGVYGDIGVELGQAIKESLLCRGEYILGQQTIRATVIGAGCHSTTLSGSTVFAQDFLLPAKNLPVARFSFPQQESPELASLIAQRIAQSDSSTLVLSFPGYASASYKQVCSLAEKLAKGIGSRPVCICLEADMAKALGQKLSLLLPKGTPCLCIDRVHLEENSYLDVGLPVGPAFPVVVKTLILSQGGNP